MKDLKTLIIHVCYLLDVFMVVIPMCVPIFVSQSTEHFGNASLIVFS